MPNEPGRIRVLALCVIRDGDRVLVGDSYDPTKRQRFYRPLGGGVDFGEPSRQAVVREIREELDAELTDLRYLGAIENIFVFDGRPGHEVVFVYEGRLADPTLLGRARVPVRDDVTGNEHAVWVRLDELARGETPLYPDGLLDLLRG